MLGLGLAINRTVSQRYSLEARQLFSRWTNSVPTTYKDALAKFIDQCKVDGNWDEMDVAWMPAQYDETNALQQLKSSSYTLTRVNSPEWLLGSGWVSDGSTSYLKTGFNPATNGIKFTQNDASIGVYSNTQSATGFSVDMGVTNSLNRFTQINPRDSNKYYGDMNDSANTISGVSNTATIGLLSQKRTSSSVLNYFIKGSSIGTDAQSSSGVPSYEFYILGRNDSDSLAASSTRRICFSFIGSKSVDMALLNTAVKNYLKTIWLLDSDVSYWYTSRPTQPSVEELGVMYEFIKGIKTDNSLSSFSQAGDLMYVFGSPTEDNAKKNIFNKAFDITKINSPSWTANSGYVSDGASSYLHANYAPATNADAVSQNDLALCIYSSTNVSEAAIEAGLYDPGLLEHLTILSKYPDGTPGEYVFYHPVNSSGAFNSAYLSTSSIGLFVAARKLSTEDEGWKNGVKVDTNTINSITLSTLKPYILARNNAGTADAFATKRIGFFALLKGSLDHAKFYTRFSAMKTYYGF